MVTARQNGSIIAGLLPAGLTVEGAVPSEAFSRATFLAAAELAERLSQSEVTRLFQRIGYFESQPDVSKKTRLNRFLDDDGPLGFNRDDSRNREFVVAVAERFANLARWEVRPDRWAKDEEAKQGVYERDSRAFLTALEADGYILSEDGTLAPGVPALGDPQPPSEAIERLLQQFGCGEAARALSRER